MGFFTRSLSVISNTLLRNWKVTSLVQHRLLMSENDQCTITILNEELKNGILIDSFSQVGFRLNNGMMTIGPIALFPRTVLSWNVNSHEDINEDSLSLFATLEPKIDILVVGLGDSGKKVDQQVIQYMRRKNINLEVLSTERACATFNFLNAENRCVAAALIPPRFIRLTEDDGASHYRNNKKFLVTDDDYL